MPGYLRTNLRYILFSDKPGTAWKQVTNPLIETTKDEISDTEPVLLIYHLRNGANHIPEMIKIGHEMNPCPHTTDRNDQQCMPKGHKNE